MFPSPRDPIMRSSLYSVSPPHRSVIFLAPVASCPSSLLPVRSMALRNITGHYEDRGLHIDMRQSGSDIVARYYGVSHRGVLRHGILTLPTLVDSKGTVLENGDIRFVGGAYWVKCDKVPSLSDDPLAASHPVSSGPNSPKASHLLDAATEFGSGPPGPVALRPAVCTASDPAPGAGAARTLWSRDAPAAHACLAADRHIEAIRGLGNDLVRVAAEAIDEISSRGRGYPTRRSNPLAAFRPSGLTADVDTPASGRGPRSRMLSMDTPQQADQTLLKSEALLQEMVALLGEEPSGIVGQDLHMPMLLRGRARNMALNETCTPIAGRALQKSEELIKDLMGLDTFAEEAEDDNRASFGSSLSV